MAFSSLDSLSAEFTGWDSEPLSAPAGRGTPLEPLSECSTRPVALVEQGLDVQDSLLPQVSNCFSTLKSAAPLSFVRSLVLSSAISVYM